MNPAATSPLPKPPPNSPLSLLCAGIVIGVLATLLFQRFLGFLPISTRPSEIAGAVASESVATPNHFPTHATSKGDGVATLASLPASPSKKSLAIQTAINLNRASLAELQRLPGIGPKLSQRIVDERERRSFTSVDDLDRVPGIGPKTVERLRPFATVSDQQTEDPAP